MLLPAQRATKYATRIRRKIATVNLYTNKRLPIVQPIRRLDSFINKMVDADFRRDLNLCRALTAQARPQFLERSTQVGAQVEHLGQWVLLLFCHT